MGFVTELHFLNDRWAEIKKVIEDDPKKFTSAIQEAMNGKPVYGLADENGRREYLGRETPANLRLGFNAHVTMYESHHADDPRLYFSFQNAWRSLSRYDLANEFGARLDNPNDHLLEVLERDVDRAQAMLDSVKDLLIEKKKGRV